MDVQGHVRAGVHGAGVDPHHAAAHHMLLFHSIARWSGSSGHLASSAPAENGQQAATRGRCVNSVPKISGLGYCLHHRRLVASAADMCEGCLMTKDAEEKGTVVFSCCRALIQISSSHKLEDTHTTREEDPSVQGKTAEEEENQGYVLLDQEDHEEEEHEQAQVDQQGDI